MTYLDDTDTALTPGAPASKTALLRDMIPFMILGLRAKLGMRGSARLARRVRADLRGLYEREKAIMAKVLKQALRSCPDWKARVLEDLGGLPAVERWRARLLRAHTPPPEEDYSWLDDDPKDWPIIEPKTPAKRSHKPKSNRPRLDRDGLFRWARIAQSRHQKEMRRARIYAPHTQPTDIHFLRPRRARKPFTAPWPIEINPADLLDPPEPEDIITLKLDPAALWDHLMCLPRQWHGEIVILCHQVWPETAAARLTPD